MNDKWKDKEKNTALNADCVSKVGWGGTRNTNLILSARAETLD